MQHYHNTTNEADRLNEFEGKAETQDEKILNLFELNPHKNMSPDNVLESLVLNCPITSIRRSISNLTKEGKLIKTDKKVLGAYGRLTYTWRLANVQLHLSI